MSPCAVATRSHRVELRKAGRAVTANGTLWEEGVRGATQKVSQVRHRGVEGPVRTRVARELLQIKSRLPVAWLQVAPAKPSCNPSGLAVEDHGSLILAINQDRKSVV